MANCQSCSRKLKWYQFKREICADCARHWNGVLAEASKTPPTEPEATAVQPTGDNYYDLNSLLTSIRVKEGYDQDELLADIWVNNGYPTRSLAASVILHLGLISLIWGLSGVTFSQPLRLTKSELERHYQITYYKASDMLPAMKSPDDGPKDPAGHKPKVKPPKGSTSFHPTQTIQSAPRQADNNSQTIVQPSTPKIQIKQEVKVPNMVVWNVPEANVEAIEIAQKKLNPLLTPNPKAAVPQLRPPDAELKNVNQNLSELHIAKTEAVNLQAKLVVPVGASAEWSIASDAGNPGPLVNAPIGGDSNQLHNLVVLSANPGLPGPGSIKVPPGNKTGAFSISPEGNREGSPDGVEGGELGGGVPGGGGTGGRGSGFGGGGNIASIQVPGLSIKGGGGAGGPAIAGPGKRPHGSGGFTEMETIEDPGESYNITVVEGRTGGAGLGVYGVLSGKRNYTVFVPMPAGRWTMQFSEMPDKNPAATTKVSANAQTVGSQVLLAAGDALIQPRPLRKVDPGRPEDEELAKLRGLVVLYAVIRKDGGVDKVRVIRSLNPALDERAVEALKQWKFKPAMLGENPVEVQALFGIPFRPQR
ncbi:MAG: energy transducer TonB [Terriglobia bacterium]